MFSRLFGGGKPAAPPPPPPSNVSRGETGGAAHAEKIDTTIELLEKKVTVNERKIEQEVEKAKQFMARGNKNSAMQCMKRKKMYEDQITQMNAQIYNLGTLQGKLQEAAINKRVLETTRGTAAELAQMNRAMNAEQVSEEREKIQEILDEQRAVTEALAEPLDDTALDEDDLLDELEGLMEAQSAAPVKQAQKTVAETPLPSMPAVPNTKLQSKKVEVDDDEEAALRDLEAQLNS